MHNSFLIKNINSALNSITIDTNPFQVVTEGFICEGCYYPDNTQSAKTDKTKYDNLDLALNDLEMFFDSSKTTLDELISLLTICRDIEELNINALIDAVSAGDKETATKLKSTFVCSSGGSFNQLLAVTQASLDAWLDDKI